jgi:quinohemoprotein ethanol dehydrogenase
MTSSTTRSLSISIFVSLFVAFAANADSAGNVTQARVIAESGKGANWFLNGGNFQGEHFSPLAQINAENIGSLKLEWSLDLPAPDGIGATPIVVDGTIYLSAPRSIVFAIDATTGKVRWTYDPELQKQFAERPYLSWGARANRGVAVWEGKVFVAAADCRLIAIDAETGREAWSEVTCDPALGYSLGDAPRVGGGKVFIGNAGSESQEKNRGYVSAYDVDDGTLIWRFFTVPSDNPDENTTPAMKMAAATWSGDAWQQFGGGGSAWNEMTYDPDSDLLFFGTAGALPYLHMYSYVLDRQNGELISAEKFAKVNWATHINLETGRPELDPAGMFWDLPEGETTAIWPNMWGAHSWHAMAYHPDLKLVYVPVIDSPQIVTNLSDGKYFDTMDTIVEVDGEPHSPGKLLAWDPVTQSERWSVDHNLAVSGGVLTTAGDLVFQGNGMGEFNAYDAQTGESLWSVPTGTAISAAPVSYQLGGEQHVLIPAGLSGVMQYFYPKIHAGKDVRGPTRLFAFTLSGDASIPETTVLERKVADLPATGSSVETLRTGAMLYADNCLGCHGKDAVARYGGSVPDLRYATAEVLQTWHAIVIGGARRAQGMPDFELSAEEADAIRTYVVSEAQKID